MPARFASIGRRLGAVLALALVLLTTGGAPAVRRSAGGAVPAGRPPAALMPFENLSGREEQAQIFTKVFFAQLVASDAFEMVDPTRVEQAMDSLGIRAAATMTPPQLKAMADTLHVPYLLLGSVLESGSVLSDNNPIPTAGATMRLVEAASGRVVWAGVHFRSGEDRETVFGWGRVKSVERLVSDLASEMLLDFREAGARRAKAEKARVR